MRHGAASFAGAERKAGDVHVNDFDLASRREKKQIWRHPATRYLPSDGSPVSRTKEMALRVAPTWEMR